MGRQSGGFEGTHTISQRTRHSGHNEMAANNDILKGRWHEVKGQLRKRWSKLTTEDVSRLNGTQEALVYALRRRYGYAPGQAAMEIQGWLTERDKDNPPARKPRPAG